MLSPLVNIVNPRHVYDELTSVARWLDECLPIYVWTRSSLVQLACPMTAENPISLMWLKEMKSDSESEILFQLKYEYFACRHAASTENHASAGHRDTQALPDQSHL